MIIRDLQVQRMCHSWFLPSDKQLQFWVEKALSDYQSDAEILIRIVGIEEMTELNEQYRHKLGATNILSFPFAKPDEIENINLLGDLVVCAEVLQQEAMMQKKTLNDHWAHIITHGILHLIGFNHINAAQALEMETKEIKLLQQLNIGNPYQEK